MSINTSQDGVVRDVDRRKRLFDSREKVYMCWNRLVKKVRIINKVGKLFITTHRKYVSLIYDHCVVTDLPSFVSRDGNTSNVRL